MLSYYYTYIFKIHQMNEVLLYSCLFVFVCWIVGNNNNNKNVKSIQKFCVCISGCVSKANNKYMDVHFFHVCLCVFVFDADFKA